MILIRIFFKEAFLNPDFIMLVLYYLHQDVCLNAAGEPTEHRAGVLMISARTQIPEVKKKSDIYMTTTTTRSLTTRQTKKT